MKLFPWPSILILVAILAISGCTDSERIVDGNLTGAAGKLELSLEDPPAEVVRVVATLLRRGYSSRTIELAISDTNKTASGILQNVESGGWTLVVEAFDAHDVVRYRGQTTVEVRSGHTAIVRLQLHPSDGSVQVIVSWSTSSFGSITVRTNKSTYERGEAVVFTIHNGTLLDAEFWHCNHRVGFALEQYVDDQWVERPGRLICLTIYPSGTIEIAPRMSISDSTDGVRDVGTYRLRFPFTRSGDWHSPQAIFSNRFSVR